ncbi:MAG TPA: plastocyanin/azurin family copper-binding protein [Candidatus Limnocylindrales bacterium]
MSGRQYGPGMMFGGWNPAPEPGQAGFVAGTTAAPRVVRVIAGPGYTFTPSIVPIVAGETITFVVTATGPTVHEFKVGPAGEVQADSELAPEIPDIGMMQTKALTYTFNGRGPYAFACHEPGHFEAGMEGTISIVS